MSNQAYVRAHTNIALIKYWGKRDEIDFLPMNSSLSMTLDKLYTDTMVVFDDSFAQDSFYLNGEKQGEKETKKISKFLDLFREEKKTAMRARVESINHVPTAAGLASSASAFAALAGAFFTGLAAGFLTAGFLDFAGMALAVFGWSMSVSVNAPGHRAEKEARILAVVVRACNQYSEPFQTPSVA